MQFEQEYFESDYSDQDDYGIEAEPIDVDALKREALQSRKLDTTEVLKNLKIGVTELGTKFDEGDWNQIEVQLSGFEREVLKCLANGIDSVPEEHPVMGETLYLSIRNNFKDSSICLVDEDMAKKSKKSKSKSSDSDGKKKIDAKICRIT